MLTVTTMDFLKIELPHGTLRLTQTHIHVSRDCICTVPEEDKKIENSRAIKQQFTDRNPEAWGDSASN